MAAYGTPSTALLGLLYGLEDRQTTTYVVASGQSLTAGRPVWVTPGTPAVGNGTYTGGDKFAGVAIKSELSTVSNVGTYNAYDTVSALEKGRIYMELGVQVTTAPVAGYIITGTGLVTTASGGNYDAGIFILANGAANALVPVEVRGLK